jgi:hypothetical protein
MHQYFIRNGRQAGQQALCFAQAVCNQDDVLPSLFVFCDPALDVAEDFVLRLPVVNRQAKGRFGNERMAFYRFKGPLRPSFSSL